MITLQRPARFAKQNHILREAKRFNVLNGGRRSSKTTLGVELAVDPVLDGFPVAWVSMSYKNFTEVWRQMTDALGPVTTRKNAQEYRIETVIPGGRFEAWTWNNIVAMRGRKYGRVIIDEAAFIPDLLAEKDSYNDVIRPTLVDYQGDAWFLSSPNGHNDFETLFNRGGHPDWREWASWRITAYDNPYIANAEIEALRHELGARLAAQEIDAEFVDIADVDRLVPSMTLWDACRADLPPLDERIPLVLALDAGVTSDCFACVGVSRHPTNPEAYAVRLVRVWTPSGAALDFDAIEREIAEVVRLYNVVHIAYDAYQLHQMAQRLGRTVWVEAFGQQTDRLIADKALLDAIIGRTLWHDGDATLRHHIQQAARKLDSDGKRLRIVKASAGGKIDAAVALSMAHHRATSLNLF